MEGWLRTKVWRQRARSAEIHRDRLLKRVAQLDRKISALQTEFIETSRWGTEAWVQAVRLNLQNRACAENAEAVLRRWKRGMDGKDTQQIIDDALAFLGAMKGRKP